MRQLVIIGGGPSVAEGMDMGLQDFLVGKFVIALNYAYHHFPYATFISYIDWQFYDDNKEALRAFPLIVGKHWDRIDYLPNTIALETSTAYCRNLECGVFTGGLVGVFALSLGIYLLDEGEIYLLGYDFGAVGGKDAKGRAVTHYYQGDIEHHGVGQTGYYTNKPLHRDFGPFATENKVKIYNVSVNSRIPYFPKITYHQFFDALREQGNHREEVKEKLARLPNGVCRFFGEKVLTS